MANKSFLRASISIALLAAVGTACSGQILSLGSNQSQLTQIDPNAVTGTVPACGAGMAHPNVCCHAALGSPSTCGVYADAPFHACDEGWKTYPDPRSCCDLNG